jgi:hypothetical protein
MSVRRHTYPEVLDRLVVAALGGVAGEPHPFPPPGGPPARHLLERPPVADVLSVHGARDRQPHRFRREVDWTFDPAGPAVVWLDAAELPDEGTLVSVNYTLAGVAPATDDLEVGGVLRTLLETIGLEVAALYAQLDAVYRSAFVDTAEGRSLDQVVGLLGIERILAGRATGDIEFRRAAGAVGVVTITAATRVITPDGAIAYETVEEATLEDTQRAIRVPARDLEPANEGLPADSLTVLPAPIAGIGAVTNPAPTTLSSRDEDDDALRRRARRFLHGSERATLGALVEAVARQGLVADVVEDPTQPGFVDVTPHTAVLTPEARLRLETALRDVRPAGVVIRLGDAQPPRLVNLALRLDTAAELLATDRRTAQRGVRAAVETYFATLPVSADASVSQLVGLALGVDGVADVRILSATWTAADGSDPANVLDLLGGILAIAGAPTVLGELQIADPALPTSIGVTVTHPDTADSVDQLALEAALDAATATLNTANADEATTLDRNLGFARLRTLLLLPDQEGATITAIDAGEVPVSAGEASPYRVSFVFTQAGGLATILRANGDVYVLAPFEQLARDHVDLLVEAS